MKKQILAWVSFGICAGLALSAFMLLRVWADGQSIYNDWSMHFRPAALNLRDPYIFERAGSYWPWFYVMISPLAILPEYVGYGILTILSIMTLTIYTQRSWRATLLCLSYPVVQVLLYGHIDALLVWALMLPPGWDIVMAAMKPQGLLCAIVRRNVHRITWKVVAPVVGLLVTSFVIWGWWPGRMSFGHLPIRQTLVLIPVGLMLLTTGNEGLWLIGGLLLTPYLLSYHTTPVLAYFYKRERWWVLMLVTIATWVVACIA